MTARVRIPFEPADLGPEAGQLHTMNAVLFAGFGGADVGIKAAGEQVDVAVNHSEVAIAVHEANHPHVEHHRADVYEVSPKLVARRRPVRLLWLSPDCTDHSNAKGGKPREHGTRGLAWVGVDWARAVRPRVIMLENVREFQDWGPLKNGKRDPDRLGETFDQFVGALSILGYHVEWRVLTCCDYGAPTSRKRLFLIARCDGQPIVWPAASHGPGLKPFRTAAEIIDWSIPAHSIFMTRAEVKAAGLNIKRPLADPTLTRLALGIQKHVVEDPDPYIVEANDERFVPSLIQTGYGERKGQAPRLLDLHKPLGTVMATGQKHAVVAAYIAKHYGNPRRKKGGGVVLGQDLRRPIGTVTCNDHHSLVVARLGRRVGGRASQVAAFLMAYYGTDAGQSLREPLRTITCTDRFGLVVLKSTGDVIDDLAMRMLVPRELLRGQFGDHEPDYDLSAAKTVKEQVLLIGNSVPPDVVEALVRANLSKPKRARRAA